MMTRRTSITSTIGVMLMPEIFAFFPDLELMAMASSLRRSGGCSGGSLGRAFDLILVEERDAHPARLRLLHSGELVHEGADPLLDALDARLEDVVGDDRRDGDEE